MTKKKVKRTVTITIEGDQLTIALQPTDMTMVELLGIIEMIKLRLEFDILKFFYSGGKAQP